MPLPLITAIASLLGGGVSHYAEYKLEEQKGKLEVQKAKTRRIANLDAEDAHWDRLMAQGAATSWSDEYWTLIISIPIGAMFFPEYRQNVIESIQALDQLPEWYRWAIGVSIASAFGFRQLAGTIGRAK